jgi:muramoyltetrapeptide carboxypeptidase LdcA involved in peptidoglycan recycling
MFPNKLKTGDEIRVVAPAKSMGVVSADNKAHAIKVLSSLGLKVTFGKHVDEIDVMQSSSIASRVSDIHDAFADPNVKGILTVLGGYNSNQLLSYLDYDLIKQNPKIICGFSDITALVNAIHAKTGLVTYSGVHFSSFAMQKGFEYSLAYFKKIFFETAPIDLVGSKEWTDDAWFLDQENRTFKPNPGFQVFNPGSAEGRIVGGHIGTFRLLQGTPYMPSWDNSIMFLEDIYMGSSTAPDEFDRRLQSLIHAPDFHNVKALVIGRFEAKFGMTPEKLQHILSTKAELKQLPIITNVDLGHTTPIFTFPIGGMCSLDARVDGTVSLRIQQH